VAFCLGELQGREVRAFGGGAEKSRVDSGGCHQVPGREMSQSELWEKGSSPLGDLESWTFIFSSVRKMSSVESWLRSLKICREERTGK
jgi:hypothetical protein